MLNQRIRQESQHIWLQKLVGLDYAIEYKEVENVVVNAFSTIALPTWFESVKDMVKHSTFFKELKEKIEERKVPTQK